MTTVGTTAELQLIANVLIDYDFIAVIEFKDETVLRRTESVLELMGRDYDYLVSRPVGGKVKERYAFLFDQKLVDVLEDGKVFPDPNDAFLREPYSASFRAGQFDFTTISAHVIWGDSVPPRQREVGELANVYRAVQAMNGAEQDVILLGDFNRNPDDLLAYQPLMSIPGSDTSIPTTREIAHQRYQSVRQHLFSSVLCDRIHREQRHWTVRPNRISGTMTRRLHSRRAITVPSGQSSGLTPMMTSRIKRVIN